MQADNRRVKNTHPKEYNGIQFKSLAEVMVYKTLLSKGIEPKYEAETYNILDGTIVTVPFYTKNKFKRKNHNIEVISKFTCKDMRPLTSMIYTPDFTFDYKGKHIIIEVKGFSTDTFVYRFKMFRASLEKREDKDKIELWEIYTKRQLLECLEHLNNDSSIEETK